MARSILHGERRIKRTTVRALPRRARPLIRQADAQQAAWPHRTVVDTARSIGAASGLTLVDRSRHPQQTDLLRRRRCDTVSDLHRLSRPEQTSVELLRIFTMTAACGPRTGCRVAVQEFEDDRASGHRGFRGVDRFGWWRLRQRPDGDGYRPLQDRVHPS
jgi:hypothetical protein